MSSGVMEILHSAAPYLSDAETVCRPKAEWRLGTSLGRAQRNHCEKDPALTIAVCLSNKVSMLMLFRCLTDRGWCNNICRAPATNAWFRRSRSIGDAGADRRLGIVVAEHLEVCFVSLSDIPGLRADQQGGDPQTVKSNRREIGAFANTAPQKQSASGSRFKIWCSQFRDTASGKAFQFCNPGDLRRSVPDVDDECGRDAIIGAMVIRGSRQGSYSDAYRRQSGRSPNRELQRARVRKIQLQDRLLKPIGR